MLPGDGDVWFFDHDDESLRLEVRYDNDTFADFQMWMDSFDQADLSARRRCLLFRLLMPASACLKASKTRH